MPGTYFPSRRLLFIILLPLLGASAASAQYGGSAAIDSMRLLLPKKADDTAKVRLLNNLSLAYYTVNPAEGLRCGEAGLALAQKIGWREGEADARNKIGINLFIQGDLAGAMAQQTTARTIYEALGQRQHIPRVMIAIASIYQRQRDYPKATATIEDALRRYAALGDQRGLASGYGSMGNVYRAQRDYGRSLQYQHKARALFEQLPHKDLLAVNLANIGSTYYEQQDYRHALIHYFRAVRIANDAGLNAYTGEYLVNLGRVYLDIAANSAAGAGNQWYAPGDSVLPASPGEAVVAAEDFLERALPINQTGTNLGVLQENYRAISAVAVLRSNYKRAYEGLANYKQLGDSILSRDRAAGIARLQAAHAEAMAEKQRELDQINAGHVRNERILMGIALGLLIVIGILWRRRR